MLVALSVAAPPKKERWPKMNRQLQSSVSLSEAADIIPTSYDVLRHALKRLGVKKDDRGRFVIPIELVSAFKIERQRSGYLHPRGAKLSDLIGRAAA